MKKKNSIAINDHAAMKVSNRIAHNATLSMFCPAVERELLPEEISAQVLRHLLDAARRHISSNRECECKARDSSSAKARVDTEATDERDCAMGEDTEAITKAVITVPAYFLPSQCEATERAGLAAGLTKVKLLREPEAAALAYGLTQEKPQIILVFDLGGGTFDCSVLEVGGGFVEVIATSGDNHLGGDDFDDVIVNHILEQVRVDISNGADIEIGGLLREHGKVMASQAHSDMQDKTMKLLASNVVKAIRGGKDPLLWNRLHDAAVTAKCTLSKEEITTIYLPMFLGPKYNVKLSLTRKNLRAYPKACLHGY